MSLAAQTPGQVPAGDVVQVCAWCKPVNVLAIDNQPGDIFTFEYSPGTRRDLQVTRTRRGDAQQYRPLTVSHGICSGCRKKVFDA